jgi:prepilin-type N-terminal cleavage/methylation domain-containing protein
MMRENKGTTLAEVMVVLAIIALFSLVVWRLFFIGHATFDEGIWRNEREQEAKVGFRIMQEDLKNMAVLSASFGTSVVFYAGDSFDFKYNQKLLSGGVKKGEKMFEFSHSRILVYKESIDHIERVVTLKELLLVQKEGL